jgi:hypothetical protein
MRAERKSVRRPDGRRLAEQQWLALIKRLAVGILDGLIADKQMALEDDRGDGWRIISSQLRQQDRKQIEG